MKYNPDHKKALNGTAKRKPLLPEIPHALTEEEWANSENLKIIRERAKNRWTE